jgi:hypothetical protein
MENVARALVRAVSRLVSTPVSANKYNIGISADAARANARATIVSHGVCNHYFVTSP